MRAVLAGASWRGHLVLRDECTRSNTRGEVRCEASGKSERVELALSWLSLFADAVKSDVLQSSLLVFTVH